MTTTVSVIQEQKSSAKRKREAAEFELPEDVSEDDEVLLTSVLTALCALDVCTAYRVKHMKPHSFLIMGTLPDESFEVDLEDLQFLHKASPLRIERVVVARVGGANELVVKVLNSKQRIMLTDTSMFYVSTRKRKAGRISEQAL
jgi:hypothetical protein